MRQFFEIVRNACEINKKALYVDIISLVQKIVKRIFSPQEEIGGITVYEQIRRKCQAAGITVTELERELKLGHGTVSKWKNGVEPRMSTLKIIAAWLGVGVAELMEE